MSSQQSALLFQVATPGLSRRGLRAFQKRLALEVGGGHQFCCLIAGDKELLRLNREFRGKNYPTDVLSFVGEDSEIAISFDAALRQATEYGHSAEEELKILMLHGLLHLLGMDHETDGGQMSKAERKWRVRLGLPAGLIERVGA